MADTTPKHSFTSDLDAEFLPFAEWLIEKVGRLITKKLIDEDNQAALTNEPKTKEFSDLYEAWMIDQKIIHTIEVDGEKPVIQSYKYMIKNDVTSKNIFVSDLGEEFLSFDVWLTEKVGEEKAVELIDEDNQASLKNEPKTKEFSDLYEEWMVDQRIIHTIETAGEKTVIQSYKYY
jgi:hypothetical protein